MAQCAYCNSNTETYEASGVPICAKCSDERESGERAAQKIRYALIQDFVDATVREKAASDEFNTVIDQFPSGMPHPDVSERIQDASRKLIAARKEMGRAHSRLNEFLDRGIIPKDLSGRR